MFNSFDKNHDGALSFGEFFKMETPYASMKDIKQCIGSYGVRVAVADPTDKYKMTEEEIEEMWGILEVCLTALFSLCGWGIISDYYHIWTYVL